MVLVKLYFMQLMTLGIVGKTTVQFFLSLAY